MEHAEPRTLDTIDSRSSAGDDRRRREALGEVSAAIAGELRLPLLGIASAAQLLRYRASEDPVVEKNVGRILREVERLNRLVASLLEYGRPHALHPTPGDPDDVWDAVLEESRGRLESGALHVERSRAASPASCPIDAEQLRLAFRHLLSNAIDAAPTATDLSFESAILPSGAWRCRLRNAGAPIPPDALPRVFDLFFSTKPGAGGVGLALCRRIVEEHGGSIAVESAAGAGTTVIVELPATG